MVEYITEKAIVRIHPGKLTEEERRVVLENAAKAYIRNLQKKGNDLACLCSNDVCVSKCGSGISGTQSSES